jgi:dTDP-4-amino-4,6-dideoxygalactose transaminase
VSRIYLSPPEVGEDERTMLLDAFDSNWIAPLGPHVDAFEAEFAERLGGGHAVALSSGTAGLHLALLMLGIGPGDDVLLPSFTFVATANVIRYLGARPVFVDSSASTWNIDPDLVATELESRSRRGQLPRALLTVDLYGQSADYAPLRSLCQQYDIPLIEDAAEALGATYQDQAVGTFGAAGVFSFNGNKIITTSGGGMLVTSSAELAHRARYLATQARDPAPHYQHSVLGFNYRLSNLLAAVGRAQLGRLDHHLSRRRHINDVYRQALSGLPGVEFMPIADYGQSNHWLTCLTIDPDRFGADREAIRLALEDVDIESRPTWKPLHLQPVFSHAPRVGGSVCADIFERGLCLPSGSALTDGDLERVIEVVTATAGTAGSPSRGR